MLEPIHEDFDSLSWGDLIVLAGSTAIEDMGGTTINFCGGRVDDSDGSDSIAIDEDTQLIYVDAGNTNGSDIRNVFANMDFTNDTETIALIAGGHTFGKCHSDRSGFEGAWTFTTTQWSGSYIENSLDLDWFESDTPSGSAKQFNNIGNTLMMLFADIALKEDADYLAALNTYRDDSDLLKKDFGSAWEKSVNRDLGDKPCAGEWPAAPVFTVNYEAVKDDVAAILENDTRSTDFNHYGPLLVRFAWHCAGTFRSTDYRGGCDGAIFIPFFSTMGSSLAVSLPCSFSSPLLRPVSVTLGLTLPVRKLRSFPLARPSRISPRVISMDSCGYLMGTSSFLVLQLGLLLGANPCSNVVSPRPRICWTPLAVTRMLRVLSRCCVLVAVGPRFFTPVGRFLHPFSGRAFGRPTWTSVTPLVAW